MDLKDIVIRRFNYPKKRYNVKLENSFYRSINTTKDIRRSLEFLENTLNYYENRDFELNIGDMNIIKKEFVKCQTALNKVVSCYENNICDFDNFTYNEVISMFEELENQYERIQNLHMARRCQD